MQTKQLSNLLKMPGTYWLPMLLPQVPPWSLGTEDPGRHQLPGLEDLANFPVEQEMAGPAYSVEATQGSGLASVLPVHSLNSILAAVEVESSFPPSG